jgi:alanine racemase
MNNRCWVEIHLAELESNLQRIRAMVPDTVKIISVVKADAYGHGLHATVARLMQSGTDIFAVANISEAISIREMGSGWPVLILSPVLPDEIEAVIENNLTPTLSSYEEAMQFSKVATQKNQPIGCHLKIDTGMGRVGMWFEGAVEEFHKIKQLPNLQIEGIYTHFATSDSDVAFTNIQRERFLNILTQFGALPESTILHADNSAGLESFDRSRTNHFNAVRIGLLQFGASPRPNSLLESYHPKPVLSFHARISLIKEVPANTSISYNKTYNTSRKTRLGILTAGYGDGIPLALSNRGKVLVQGKLCPILGRVTMDQTIIDLTDNPEASIGDIASFIGKQKDQEITIQEFAKNADSIPWEVLCSITKRVQRVYKTNRQ